jgi:hypothetical protein
MDRAFSYSMLAAAAFAAYAPFALANDTAINAGAHGPAPLGEFAGEESVIRMVSETIDIRFGRMQTDVVARFTFRSSKPGGDARQSVGFPDLYTGEDLNRGDITALTTLVDGREVDARKVAGWFEVSDYGIPRSGLGEPRRDFAPESIQRADFYVVDVVFPPNQDVVIERRYTVTNGGDVTGASTFHYTTHTGAVWKDAIGKAEFRVTLDGWKIDDLAFEDGPQRIPPRQQTAWTSPNLNGWTVVSPTELKMTWTDFEPAAHKTRRGLTLATWSRRRDG